jgi:hypothetical protein
MGEAAVAVVKWVVRISIILTLVFAFLVFFNFVYSLVGTAVNNSVIGDLMSLVQMWAPFDIDVIFSWVLTASSLYLGYRVIIFAVSFLNRFLN